MTAVSLNTLNLGGSSDYGSACFGHTGSTVPLCAHIEVDDPTFVIDIIMGTRKLHP